MYMYIYICIYIYNKPHVLSSQVQRRASLSPPAPPDLTWGEYISSAVGEPPLLGREHVRKTTSKHFKATMAMVHSNTPILTLLQ